MKSSGTAVPKTAIMRRKRKDISKQAKALLNSVLLNIFLKWFDDKIYGTKVSFIILQQGSPTEWLWWKNDRETENRN